MMTPMQRSISLNKVSKRLFHLTGLVPASILNSSTALSMQMSFQQRGGTPPKTPQAFSRSKHRATAKVILNIIAFPGPLQQLN